MAYTAHNFTSGDTLYASQLNEMDTQIVANETSIESIREVNGGIAMGDTQPTEEYVNVWIDTSLDSVGTVDRSHTHDNFDNEVTFNGGIHGMSNYPEIKEEDLPIGVEELTGGKWIDGKPIYRYTWKGVSARSGSQGTYGQFPDGEPETVISLRGTFQRPSDGAWFSIPATYYNDTQWSVNIRTSGSGQFTVGFGEKYTADDKPMILVAEYTKSTD